MNACSTSKHSVDSTPSTALRGKTKIGWSENRILKVAQFYCEKCEQFFCYEDDNESWHPNFCPICGRINTTAQFFIAPDLPPNPKIGEHWTNQDTKLVFTWTGKFWELKGAAMHATIYRLLYEGEEILPSDEYFEFIYSEDEENCLAGWKQVKTYMIGMLFHEGKHMPHRRVQG